jgi:hypothetical protein
MFCIVIVVVFYYYYYYFIVTVAIEENFESTGLERQHFVTTRSHGEGSLLPRPNPKYSVEAYS